jgi:ABC-type Fe3+-hydroxamate transport system substrate-binding protein
MTNEKFTTTASLEPQIADSKVSAAVAFRLFQFKLELLQPGWLSTGNLKTRREIKLRKVHLLITVSMFLAACGGAAGNAVNNSNTVKPNTNSANGSTTATNAATNTSANTPKPADSGPKRIEFKKGEVSGTESLTLSPGSLMQFVVNAGNDQKLYIESSDKAGKIKIANGKVNEISNENGYFEGVTTAKGDVIFSVTNNGKAEMKTKLSVTLVDNGD